MPEPLKLRRRPSIFLLSICVAFVLDTVFFKSGIYDRYIKPDSAAGSYRCKVLLGKLSKHSQSPPIAVLGDSRMSEGFSASYFENLTRDVQLKAVNLAIPGSSLRVWYYMLEQIDPRRDSFRLLVIPLESFSGVSNAEDLRRRTADLAFISPFVLPSFALDLVSTYASPSAWCQIAAESLFKGYSLRADIKEFLVAPRERYKDVRTHEIYYRDAERSYGGNPDSLTKLFCRQASGLSTGSDRVILNRIATANAQAKSGEKDDSTDFWLKRIINCYSRSKTKLLIVQIPQSPTRPRGADSQQELVLDSTPIVSVVPAQEFRNLEQSRYFFDDLHLNRDGRMLFTEQLSSSIVSALGMKSAASHQVCFPEVPSKLLISNKKLIAK